MTALLRADSIGKRFGDRPVLTSAGFTADAGEVTALMGRNGAGKSTLLKIVAGWLAQDHGFVEYRGVRHVRPQLARFAAEGMFHLPVDRSILSPRFTLREHADAVERRYGAGPRAELLARLGVAHLHDVATARFSGGERRRAELVLALLRRPACLLVDEPFSGIDPADCEVVLDVLRRVACDGCAVVLTGHEIGWVMRAADRIVWVHARTAYPLGTPAEAAAHDAFRREYLGPQ